MYDGAPQEIIIPFSPRPLQRDIFNSLKRFSVLVCHRRFGKTVLCINKLIRSAIEINKPNGRFAYFAPLYRQAKQVAWDYLKQYTAPIPGIRVFESELRVDLPNGSRIQLFGSDNPDAVRGVYLDGVVLDEYAQMPARMFAEILRPALSDRLGWAIFIGTPKGRNAFCELYEKASGDPEWYAALYKASESGIVPESELQAARRQMSEDQYNQEFECSFEAAIPGAYYGVLMRQALDAKRICSVPHDPSVGVETWWDLGIGDPTAIWFVQRVGQELHAIDYHEASGEGLAYYAGILQQKQQELRYVYTDDVLPHDAGAKSLQTGKPLAQTLKELTGREPIIMPRSSVEAGIEAARNIIPRMWFDADKCGRGIECLRQYRQQWDDTRQAFMNHPLHDWTSHGADAFRTGCQHKPTTGFQKVVYPKNHVSNRII